MAISAGNARATAGVSAGASTKDANDGSTLGAIEVRVRTARHGIETITAGLRDAGDRIYGRQESNGEGGGRDVIDPSGSIQAISAQLDDLDGAIKALGEQADRFRSL